MKNNHLKTFSLLILLQLVASCSTTNQMFRNEKAVGHHRLYSFPTKVKMQDKQDDRVKRIVFASTNNFNGQTDHHMLEIHKDEYESKKDTEVNIGGATAIKSYLDILRKEYRDQVIYVDSGSFSNPLTKHLQTVFLLNYLGIKVANLGVNEFNLETNMPHYPSYLSKVFDKANFDIVASNIFDLNQVKNITWRNVQRNTIRVINGVQIGFIGLLDPNKTKQIPSKNINGLYIQNMAKSIIENSNVLRKKGAELIVVLGYSGIDCTSLLSHDLKVPELKVNFNPRSINACDIYSNSLTKSLSQLPPKMVDLVITGGMDSKVANFVNEIPIMQNHGNGEFLSWTAIYFDTKLKRILPSKTQMFQPVQLCHKFLDDTEDCFVEETDKGAMLIPATFLGHKVDIQPLPKHLR